MSAPSLFALGAGEVRLDGSNDLAGGVTAIDASLTVGSPAALGTGPLTMRSTSLRFSGSQEISNELRVRLGTLLTGADGGVSLRSSTTTVRMDPGATVTFTSPVDILGSVQVQNGLLRLMGGGSIAGQLGMSLPAAPSRFELGGTFTTAPTPFSQTSLFTASGEIYGNAMTSLAFASGLISAGAPGEVGTLQVAALSSLLGSFNQTTVQVEVTGTSADRLIVVGVTGGFVLPPVADRFLLSLNVITPPVFGTSFTIIQNDTTAAVISPFVGLTENAIYTNAGNQFRVSYIGGDGNDITLTAIPEPATLAVNAIAVAVLARRRRA